MTQSPYEPPLGARAPYDPPHGAQVPYEPTLGAQVPYDPLLGAQTPYEPAPLSAEEKARAEVTFAAYVAEMLKSRGRFRTSAGRPEMVELFQRVARRVGEQLGRSVVSVSNGREITITLGAEADTAVTGCGVRLLQ
jgi:hypothetical protein